MKNVTEELIDLTGNTTEALNFKRGHFLSMTSAEFYNGILRRKRS